MKRIFLNFRKSARERAAEMTARAYSHYRRFEPIVGKVYNPIKKFHNKHAPWYQTGKKK